MRLGYDINLIQEQKLALTQEMQQSLKILQMSAVELQEHIQEEVAENPLLEVDIDGDANKDENRLDYKELMKYLEFDRYDDGRYEREKGDDVSPFQFVTSERSLNDFLKEQVIELNITENLVKICEYLIDSLDYRGYMVEELEHIASELYVPMKAVEEALKTLQSLDPPGVGARDLKECLSIQVHRRGIQDEMLQIIIAKYLELLGENKYAAIAKALNTDIKQIQRRGDMIKTLEPKPSRGFFTGEEVNYVVPEAYIKKIGNDYVIHMNDKSLPKLLINESYKRILYEDTNKEATDYVKQKLNKALFFIKSIDQRKNTIYRVLERLVELQKDFFDFGEMHLKPMTLKEIADSIGMHESTVSRAIRDKYIYTNQGMLKLRDLFSAALPLKEEQEGVSIKRIKSEIKRMIDEEDKKKPLSDQDICDILTKHKMMISRRTVAKYREEMDIPSSSKRRRF